MTSDRANAAEPDRPAPGFTQEQWVRGQLEHGSDREIAARGPGRDTEELRRAYLDLLKLALCDLAGTHTLTVSRSGDGRATKQPLFTRELAGDELALRVMGADWPYGGLTMIGLERLDDLQACAERTVAEGVEGDVIEAGSWRGGASILIRATLDTLGEDQRTVWVADSFQGLPEPDEAFPEDIDLDLSWLGYLAVPQQEVQRYFERFGLQHGVRFLEGFFDATLPTLADRSWALVRLDGDTYESTWVGLESLYPGLSQGGFVVIDDYQLIPECRQAVDDYRRRHGIEDPIEMIDTIGARWRRESTAGPREDSMQPRRRPARPAVARTTERRDIPTGIPTLRELQLERKLREMEERHLAAEPAPRRLARRLRKALSGEGGAS